MPRVTVAGVLLVVLAVLIALMAIRILTKPIAGDPGNGGQ